MRLMIFYFRLTEINIKKTKNNLKSNETYN